MQIDVAELRTLIRKGFVNETKHPEENLWIYNYSQKAQYEGKWTPLLMQCRGLILDGENNVVSRPFKKFLNLSEYGPEYHIPNKPYKVYEKLDGSCLISYWARDKMFWATRGSFVSDQAIAANKFWQGRQHKWFKPKYTYVGEWIAPENRIVVDYKGLRDIVFTAVIDTQTGQDIDIGIFPPEFPTAKVHKFKMSIPEIQAQNNPNEEGYVIRFEDGFRVKLKFEEYCRLHAIVTNISSYDIWNTLRLGESLDEVIDRVPDEFFDWVKNMEQSLTTAYSEIENKARRDFGELDIEISRREFAEQAKRTKYPGLMFSLLDKKDITDTIWRLVKPIHEKPFR